MLMKSFKSSFHSRIIWIGIISIIFTSLIIHYSLVCGRLSTLIGYDDIGYFNDALWRLNKLYSEGPFAFFHTFLTKPPHSPYSTFFACVSFMLFGIKDWAPYASNVVVVFLVLFFVDLILKKTSFGIRLSCAILTLTFPFIGGSVHEFRPDLPAGAITAIGIILLLVPPLVVDNNNVQRILAGTAFGIALIAKPTVFPVTLILMIATLFLATLRDKVLIKKETTVYGVLRNWGVCIIPALVLFLPLFLLTWEHYVGHMYANIFGSSKDFWEFRGTLLEHILYYVTDMSSTVDLGWMGKNPYGKNIYLLLLIILCGNIVAHIKGKKEDATKLALLSCITVLVYLIPTVNQIKSPFFGSTLYYMLLFTSIFSIRITITYLEKVQIIASRSFLITIIIVGIFCFKFPAKIGERGADWKANVAKIDKEIYSDIVNDGLAKKDSIFYTFCGILNVHSLRYRLLKNGYNDVFLYEYPLSDNLDLYIKAFNSADFVVAGESGCDYAAAWTPSAKVMDSTLYLLRQRKDFVQMKTYRTPNGKSYYLFRKIQSFLGWNTLNNFGPEEGPYPQWDLPIVRWGYGPSSTIEFEVTKKAQMTLFMEASTSLPNNEMIIILDGMEIGRYIFQKSYSFDKISFSFLSTPGKHSIELFYDKWHKPKIGSEDNRPFAVLFRSMVISPSTKE